MQKEPTPTGSSFCDGGDGGGFEASRRAPAAKPHRSPKAADTDIFAIEIILDAVFRTFLAHTRFLDAAERRDLCRDQPLVDADHAVFQRFGDAEGAAEVLGVEIGG